MELIKEIKDKEIPENDNDINIREAVRGVFVDDEGRIPFLFFSRYKFHKLPGGGIDKGESRDDALRREVLEETGSEINIVGDLGKIVEFRSKWTLKQISYCYFGVITGKGEPDFSKSEKEDGFRLFWMSPRESLFRIKNDSGKQYDAVFIQQREEAILEKYKDLNI